MKQYLFLLLLPVSLIAYGCGHTNNLAKHDVREKTVLYRIYSSTRGSSAVHVESPVENNLIADIAAAVGSGIAGEEARKKLNRAIDADSIAMAVGQGIQSATSDYLSMRPVASIENDPDYIIETELREFKIESSEYGLKARVCARSRIINRRTGELVWEDSEAHNVSLSETAFALFGPDVVQSGTSIFNAAKLLNLGEEEIRGVFAEAAEQAGREIGETLREDVADLND